MDTPSLLPKGYHPTHPSILSSTTRTLDALEPCDDARQYTEQ
jgi:hypothetical protein